MRVRSDIARRVWAHADINRTVTNVERARYDAFHEVSGTLSDDATLWRYMDLPKLLSLLEDKAIHFARVDQMTDPREGSVSEPTLQPPDVFVDANGQNPVPLTDDDRRSWLEEIRPKLSLIREHMRRRTWVCCWEPQRPRKRRTLAALRRREIRDRCSHDVRPTRQLFGTDPLPPYSDGPRIVDPRAVGLSATRALRRLQNRAHAARLALARRA